MPHADAQINPILAQAGKEAATKVADTTATPKVVSTPAPEVSSKLQAVEDALGVSTQRITSSITALEAGRAETRVATEAITGAIGDITAATQITKAASDTADLQAQNATIRAFEASGGADIQANLMATLRADQQRVAGLLDEKQDIIDDEFTGVQIIDGIINEFRSFQTSLEIDAATAQQAQTVKEISSITAATESFAQANALTKKTLNEGVIEANQKFIAAQGQLKASQAEIQNINANATAMSNLVQADSRNVSNLVQQFRLEGEVEERALKQERMVFQREQMAFAREKWQVELPAAKVALDRATLALEDSTLLTPERRLATEANFNAATKRFNDLVATEDQLVEAVQKGQSLAGAPIEERETIVFGLNQTGAVGAKYARLQELGGATDPVLGATAFEAGTSLQLVAPSGNVTQTPGIKALEAITDLQAQVYKKAGKVPKDEETLSSDFNGTAQAFMDTKAANINTGDATNPYHAPPFSVLETMTSVISTELYTNVLKAMEMKEVNPQKILDAAIAGVRAGSVSPESAASGVEAIFDAAALYNNTMQGGFRRVGLPNQVTYNTQIQAPVTGVDLLKLGITSAPSAALFGLTALLPTVGIEQAGDSLAESIAKKAKARTTTVDMMDGTRIQEAIVKLLSSTAPKETTPIAEK